MKRVVAVLAGIFTLLAMASAAGAEAPCLTGQKCSDKNAPKPQATPRTAPPQQQMVPRPAPRPQAAEPQHQRRPEVSRPPVGEPRQPGRPPSRQQVQPPPGTAPMSPAVQSPMHVRPRPESQPPRANAPTAPAPTVQPPTHTGPRTGPQPPQVGAPMAPSIAERRPPDYRPAPRAERPPVPHQAPAVAHRPRPVEMRRAEIREHHRFYAPDHYRSHGWRVRHVDRPHFFIPIRERYYFRSIFIVREAPIFTYIDEGAPVVYVLYCSPLNLFFLGPDRLCPVPWEVRFVVD